MQLSFESIMNEKKNKCRVESDHNAAYEISELILSIIELYTVESTIKVMLLFNRLVRLQK